MPYEEWDADDALIVVMTPTTTHVKATDAYVDSVTRRFNICVRNREHPVVDYHALVRCLADLIEACRADPLDVQFVRSRFDIFEVTLEGMIGDLAEAAFDPEDNADEGDVEWRDHD